MLITSYFLLDGFVFANWVVRVPQIKAHVGASAGTLGLALLGVSIGAIATMTITGRLCRRFGSRAVTVVTAVLLAASVALPAVMPTVATLGATLFVFGAGWGGMNVAINSAAVDVIGELDRPIMPSFHAAYSLGGLLGSVVAGVVADHVGAAAHLATVGIVSLAAAVGLGIPLLRCAPLATELRGTPVPMAERTTDIAIGPISADTTDIGHTAHASDTTDFANATQFADIADIGDVTGRTGRTGPEDAAIGQGLGDTARIAAAPESASASPSPTREVDIPSPVPTDADTATTRNPSATVSPTHTSSTPASGGARSSTPARSSTRPSSTLASTGASARQVKTVLYIFSIIVLCSSFGEGAMSDWGALHLRTDLHTSAGLAAAGYAAFSIAMFVGRLSGSWVLSRIGRTAVLAGGCITAGVGMLGAALLPSLPAVLIGFVFVGLGLSNVFPATVGQAGVLLGPSGVATASTFGYSGFLTGPPLIGFLADRFGLPIALTSISVLAGLAAAIALLTVRQVKQAETITRGTPEPVAALV
ncbi:MFS transporter [Actinospica durhamensis]|uniref:MFS transporter n=1 Tax=Actinospica durhamensis TaxID=1508375 RepID=UPI001BA8F5AD|nr:MFS transporter [Actinospica durhamensis]